MSQFLIKWFLICGTLLYKQREIFHLISHLLFRQPPSQQVKYSCSVMGIQHVTTVRYRPTSMLVELYNQVFLRCIRFLYQTERTPPQSVGKLVTRVCHIINTSPFLRCKEISPYSLFHPTKQPNFHPSWLNYGESKANFEQS